MNTPLERILTGCLFKRRCFITFYKYITVQEQTLSVDGRLGIYEKRVTLWSPS